VQKGHTTQFVLDYLENNRDELLSNYPTFTDFNQRFTADKKFMDTFFDYVKKEDSALEFNADEYKVSESLLKLRLKAVLAQDIWGYNEFYQIYNESNEILQRAVEVIKTEDYKKLLVENQTSTSN
jgi:carboxyl-terminal processing protease